MTTTLIEAAMERVVTALRRYVAVVTETPELSRTVIGASEDVRVAGLAFETIVTAASGWQSRMFLSDDESTDDGETGGRSMPAGAAALSVRTRTDYLVTDLERLLAAGREAYRELWPADPAEAAVQRVDAAETAVGELIHRQPFGILGELDPAEVGLAEAGAVTEVGTVDRVLDMDDSDDWPTDPFALD